MKHLFRILFMLIFSTTLVQGAPKVEIEDLLFIVIIKSSNYAQRSSGELELMNYHFFSEVFAKDDGTINSASIVRRGSGEDPQSFEVEGKKFRFEGGHFNSLAEVDTAFPNGEYIINVSTPSGNIENHVMKLEGDSGQTEIPAPITITLWQDGREMAVDSIDPDKELTVTWSEYTGARRDPNNIVHDMIFVVVANCHGKRIVHTGPPFVRPDYLTFEATEHKFGPGVLNPGEPYSMFVEFPRAMHTAKVNGVPTFSSFETATYLDFHTLGQASGPECPENRVPLDTGQTDR